MLSIVLSRAILMTTLAFGAESASAAVNAKPQSSGHLVAELYKNFAWQAIAHQADFFGEDLAHQRRGSLDRYFSPALAQLLVHDAACQVKSQGICNLDFDLLFDSQDPRVSDLNVEDVATGTVMVTFKDPVNNEESKIVFHLSQVAGKWKISDIIYGKGRSRSLLQLLSRKIPDAP